MQTSSTHEVAVVLFHAIQKYSVILSEAKNPPHLLFAFAFAFALPLFLVFSCFCHPERYLPVLAFSAFWIRAELQQPCV
jgi:hypothetical protein